MVLFRRIAFSLALTLPALIAAQAQSSSSTSDATSTAQAQGQAPTQQQLSVQARIKARREKRRADAIHEAYGHLYEAYAGGGYLRFRLPSPLQRVNEYAWNVGFTRYKSERLGVTVDGRGTYGTAFTYDNANGISNPSISQYALMAGPTYRFYLQPKYAISGRVLGGFAYGNFSGDTSGDTSVSTSLGLYQDGATYALNAAVIGEYNVSPGLSIRLAPEFFGTGFGSSFQHNLGFNVGVNYRFGKQ